MALNKNRLLKDKCTLPKNTQLLYKTIAKGEETSGETFDEQKAIW